MCAGVTRKGYIQMNNTTSYIINFSEIAARLVESGYRFIRVEPRGKRPIDIGWNKQQHFSGNEKPLLEHLESGGNYGVKGDFEHIIIDIDNPALLPLLEQLPPTFTVRSGSGRGIHAYYLCKNEGSIRLLNPDNSNENWGDIQAEGKQVIGPGCIHPSGGTYVVENDIPVATITLEDITRVFGAYIRKRRVISPEEIRRSYREHGNLFDSISLSDVGCFPASPGPMSPSGEIQGGHPLHGSTTGFNFSINPRNNVWHCFPAGTLVDTPIGLKPIEDIKIDDVVYGRKGQFNKVTTTFKREYSGKLFGIYTPFLPIRVTEGHPILVARCGRCKKNCEPYIACKPNCPRKRKDGKHNCAQFTNPEMMWVNVENINPDTDFVVLPKNESVENIEFDLTKYRVLRANGEWAKQVPDKITLNEETSKIFGLYLAEGHLSNGSIQGKKRYYDRIQFTFGLSEIELAKQLSRNILTQFNINSNVYQYPSRSTTILNCVSTIIAKFLYDIFGSGAKNKTVGVCLHANPEILKTLYDYYFIGDGYYSNNPDKYRYNQVRSISKILIEEFQIFLFNIGIYNNSYSSPSGKMSNGYNISEIFTLQYPQDRKQIYGWQDNTGTWYLPIKKITCEEFSGTVYNIETEDHTYQVPFVVHNCYRHGTGGGPLEWLAIAEGVISCDGAGPGCLRGDIFKRVLEIARGKGLKIPEVKRERFTRPKILDDEPDDNDEDENDWGFETPVNSARIVTLDELPDKRPDNQTVLIDAPPRLGKTHHVISKWVARDSSGANIITTSHNICKHHIRVFKEYKNEYSLAVHLMGKDKACIQQDGSIACPDCPFYPYAEEDDNGQSFLEFKRFAREYLENVKILTKDNAPPRTCPYYLSIAAEPHADFVFTVAQNLERVSQRDHWVFDEDPSIGHFFAESAPVYEATFHGYHISATSHLEEKWKGIQEYKTFLLSGKRPKGRKTLLRIIEILEQVRALLPLENISRDIKTSLLEELNNIDLTIPPPEDISPYQLIEKVKRFEKFECLSPFVEALLYQYCKKKFIWTGDNPATLHIIADGERIIKPVPEGKITIIGNTRAELFIRAIVDRRPDYKVVRINKFPFADWFILCVLDDDAGKKSGKKIMERLLKSYGEDVDSNTRLPSLVLTGSEKDQGHLHKILGGIAHCAKNEGQKGHLWNYVQGSVNIFYQNSVISRGIDVDIYTLLYIYSSDFANPYWQARLLVAKEEDDIPEQEFVSGVLNLIVMDETTNSLLRISPTRKTNDGLPRIVCISKSDLWKVKDYVSSGIVKVDVNEDIMKKAKTMLSKLPGNSVMIKMGKDDDGNDSYLDDLGACNSRRNNLGKPDIPRFSRELTEIGVHAYSDWKKSYNILDLDNISECIRAKLQLEQTRGKSIREDILIRHVMRSAPERKKNVYTVDVIARVLHDMVRTGEVVREGAMGAKSYLSLRERFVRPGIGDAGQFDV